MSIVMTLIVIAAALLLALGLAYVPMRLLIAQMAKNIRQFIERQRDRRLLSRNTPDRRRA